MISKDLGAVSAYGMALDGGLDPEISKQEYAELLASYGTVAQEAADSAGRAAQAANAAGQILGQTTSACDAAISAKNDAVSAKDTAAEAANVAGRYESQAQSAKTDAESARDTAVNAVDGFAAGAQQALESVNEAGSNWKSLAERQAGNSEAWAVGQRSGVDVPTTDATYHNNAKYYAEQASSENTSAQTARQGAETAATNASQSATDAATSASQAAESARTLTIDTTLTQEGQAADAKVVGDEITGLKEDLSELDAIVFPNEDMLVHQAEGEQSTANRYWSLAGGSALTKGNAYRIVLKFSDIPSGLTAIRTATGTSGSTNVDSILSNFVGESWTDGKVCIYTPTVDGIKNLQTQFVSSYSATLLVTLSVYDYSKEQEPVTVELQSEISEKQVQIDSLKYVIDLDKEYNLLPSDGYEVGKYISIDGTIGNDPSLVLSDYIELDPSQTHICNFTKTASVVNGSSEFTGNVNTFNRFRFCFFDENKKVVPFTGDESSVSKEIPSGAKYIRVTILSENEYPLARLIYGNFQTQPIVRIVDYKKTQQKKYESPNTGFEDFKMVMFGDSITHGSLSVTNNGTSYVNFANDYLHSNIVNVGFGGTRMTYALSGAGLFCFYHLCECVVSDDPTVWDGLIAYATDISPDYMPHLQALMNMDWSTVKAVGLMYGANDYTSNTPVGESYNETLTNYDGACAYGLKLLLTKYPHLQVLILAPFDREMTVGNPDTMTDRAQNKAGLTIADYAKSLENVQSRFHCPLIKTEELFGINQYNILTYAPDGTHPRANIAQKRLGWLFAHAVLNNLAPFNG